MRKLSLSEWASVAEIFGAIMVVVSLLFLAREVNQNTAEIRSAKENTAYDRVDSLNSSLTSDPELASLFAKRVYDLDIVPGPEAQLLMVLRREMNQWEQFYYWHEQGVVTPGTWDDWDTYYVRLFKKALPSDWWAGLRDTVDSEFAQHVDRIYDTL